MYTELALLGYIAWTLFLVVALEVWRSYLVVAKGRDATSFQQDGEDTSERMARLCAAYYNCAENFPVFGGLLLFVILKDWTGITDSLALVFLLARIIQSSAHIAAASLLATNIRATAYFVQLAIALYWLFRVVSNLVGVSA